MWRHRVLLLLWSITIVTFALGFMIATGLAVLAQFAAFALAGVTVHRAQRLGVLRHPWIYRGALLLLLAATGTTLISAGSTVVVRGGEAGPTVGLITLASTNLVAAILTWRALTRPSPRRAALVGLLAVVAELVALCVDAAISINLGYDPTSLGVVALIASFAATWAGALVCIATLVSFEPSPMYVVPAARVIDE
jgi:hypothetical protein